jgi:DnaJ-class molecular chaperone
MDRMINSAPMSGGISDSAYDRSEDAVIKMQTCHECNGEKYIYYSDCCGAEIIKGICYDCKDKCNEESEICYHCDGEGEVEI